MMNRFVALTTVFSAFAVQGGDFMKPLPAGSLHLAGGLDREIRLSQKGWILGDVPYGRFVEFFRTGRPKFAVGEMWGKFVRSGAMFYRYTHDPQVAVRMKEAVEDLLKTERSNGSISCTPVEEQPGNKGGDLWERKYVLLGLEGYYAEIDRDPRVLASMKRQADAILAQVGPAAGHDIRDLGWSPNRVESSTLLEPIMRLYVLTREQRYLDFARYLVDCGGAKGSNLIDMANANVPPHLMGGAYPKAYETTSYYEGLADYVRVTGDERVKGALLSYFRLVRDRELTIVGNGGADQPFHPRVCGEAWSDTAREQTNPDITRMMETCTGVTWMKYCSHILRMTGDCSAAEAIEKYVYNGLIGAMKPDGRGFSYVNLLDGAKVTNQGWGWDFDGKRVTCCNLNGPMGLAYIPYIAVMQGSDGPVINLYNGLTAQAKTRTGKSVHLLMTTDYPCAGHVSVVVTPEEPESFPIRFRNPSCSAATEVFVNGNRIEMNTAPADYCEVSRQWKKGDRLDISFALRGRLIKGPRGVNRAGDGRVAVVYGCVVLARDERLDPNYDKPVKIVAGTDGTIAVRRLDPQSFGARMAFEVPTESGPIIMIDYASVDCWNGSHVRTWLPTAPEKEGRTSP